MRSAWLVAALLPAAAAAQDDLFAVVGGGDQALVSANRSGVPADEALRSLAGALGWGLEFETPALENRLSTSGVDVAVKGQNPRTTAQLLAIAGGGDVVFSDRSVLGQQTTRVIVVAPAAADTESGRQRLRQQAVRWYRTFLDDELAEEPLVQEHGMDARMHLAQLLREQGAVEEAAVVYREVQTVDPTHDYVPMALLRLAECRFELGAEHWTEAERAARDLTRRHPSLPQAAAGTVLLGKILLAQQRYAECVKTMTAAYLRLAGTPEVVDLYLLVGTAEYELGNAENVLRAMDTLEGAHEARQLEARQQRDFLFLRGYALNALGRHEDALEPLEALLGTGPDDARRGIAFVLLGRSYLALQKYVEARAAAIEAHHLKVGGKLAAKWAREASKLFAKTALEIGDRDAAFEKLEVEVRKSPESEPELVVYLIHAFMDEERWQKAIITCDLIADLDGEHGDEARLLRIEAMWKQSLAAGGTTLATFTARALPYAQKIRAKDHLRRVAEIFGRAFELNGDIERAADAYRGLLRWN